MMIKNLLLIAMRNFRKDKWYSVLNVLGLTIGITFSLFLMKKVTEFTASTLISMKEIRTQIGRSANYRWVRN